VEQPNDKATLLIVLRRQKTYWEGLLALVSEEDMLVPGVVDDWAFKDLVAHLTGWRKRTLARFLGAQQGGKLPAPEWPAELGDEVSKINPWIYRSQHDRPLADVLMESMQVWQQLLDAVEALPEADLMTPGRYDYMGGYPLGPANLRWSYGHLHEHAAQINDWLARRYDEG
jgi:hypothetical protein